MFGTPQCLSPQEMVRGFVHTDPHVRYDWMSRENDCCKGIPPRHGVKLSGLGIMARNLPGDDLPPNEMFHASHNIGRFEKRRLCFLLK